LTDFTLQFGRLSAVVVLSDFAGQNHVYVNPDSAHPLRQDVLTTLGTL
jgi:hypothetical protein